MKWQPMNDGVLVQRIDKPAPASKIVLTDETSSNSPILREGIVLAVGPGKRDEDGYREPLAVKPGDKVLFNARWNDLAHQELKGTGSDGSGQLERPLSYKFDPTIHLIQEADIAGLLG